MKKEIDISLFDKRVVHRWIDRGLLTEEDYKRFMESLEDTQDKAEKVKVEIEEKGKDEH